MVCFVYLVWHQTDQRDGAITKQTKCRFTGVESARQRFVTEGAGGGNLGGKTAESSISSSEATELQ